MSQIIENKKVRHKSYDYIRLYYEELTDELLRAVFRDYTTDKRAYTKGRSRFASSIQTYKYGNGKHQKNYIGVPCGFDIETTRVGDFSTMYLWQMAIGDAETTTPIVIHGNEWAQVVETLDRLKAVVEPLKSHRLIVADANLGFEFAFMRKWLTITADFHKEARHPLTVEHDNFIEFFDILSMGNCSLSKLSELYNLNTLKADGDLDYNKVRNKESIYTMTEEENVYADNDVLIECDFMRYYMDTYLSKHQRPLTITATLRQKVKDLQTDKDLEEVRSNLPKNVELYNWLTSSNKSGYGVYTGGFVHANKRVVGYTFTREDLIRGFDFTSSYPSVALYEPVDCGKLIRLKNPTLELINKYSKQYHILWEARFNNIVNTTDQSIISKSKCIDLDGVIEDNGRVERAKSLTTSGTELDLELISKFYTFDEPVFLRAYIGVKKRLPLYLAKPLVEDYHYKCYNKRMSLDYAIQKACVNSYYGMTVTRRVVQEVHYDPDSGLWYTTSADSYEEWKEKAILNPLIGVYISAYARYNLLSTVYRFEAEINKTVAYCDTDSLKVIDWDNECQRIIDEYNEGIKAKYEASRELYNLSEEFEDLGYFDYEYGKGTKSGEVVLFKTLGCKRYCITTIDKDGVYHNNQTICGLPKGELFKGKTTLEEFERVYERFEDKMEVSSVKLTPKYIDDEFELEIDGVMHREKSCLTLRQSDYTLKINQIWKKALDYYMLQSAPYELRANNYKGGGL